MKKKVFILFLALLLSVTATYSWILENTQEEPADKLLLQRGVAYRILSPQAYTLEVYRFGPSGEEIRVNTLGELGADNMLPGDGVRFRLKLTNSSDLAGDVRLLMTGISCAAVGSSASNPSGILDYMYLSVTPSDGYTGEGIGADVAPAWVYGKLSDLMAGSEDSAVIYPKLTVPNTFTGESVNLDCRLWFDTAAEGLENVRLDIGEFMINT